MVMMIQKQGNDYLFTFDKPETEWIYSLAHSMGITNEAVVAAAMNKGLTYYLSMITEIKEHDKKDIDDDACDDIC